MILAGRRWGKTKTCEALRESDPLLFLGVRFNCPDQLGDIVRSDAVIIPSLRPDFAVLLRAKIRAAYKAGLEDGAGLYNVQI